MLLLWAAAFPFRSDMMRTEVKIGIGVAILLAAVVVGYVVLHRGGDAKPAGNAANAAGNQVAKANNAPNIIYESNTANASRNTAGSNSAARNGSLWDVPVNAANNAANNATRTGGYYDWANTASNNVAGNGSNVAVNTTNAAGNNVASNNSSATVDWTNSGLWGNETANTNTAGTRTGGSDDAATTGQTRSYTVKASDTSGFWGIAALPEVYGDGKHWKLLEEANKGVDTRTLQAGTVLKVPPLPTRSTQAGDSGSVTSQVDGSKVYIVAEGDSLWKIAEKTLGSGTKVDALKKANPGLTDNIKPGQKIILPDAATVTATTNTPRTETRPATSTGTNRPNDNPNRPLFR